MARSMTFLASATPDETAESCTISPPTSSARRCARVVFPLPAVEEGTITLIGATTENPYFSLVTPLLSRSLLLRLEPLSLQEVRTLLLRALEDENRGLGGIPVKVED
ncbi:MAG TPA: hypothetical protein VMY78_13905, partial [Solirubrobacteraceae bacterium]|nr:hypothetical protein [Solirubrobacteraceae bacterium]